MGSAATINSTQESFSSAGEYGGLGEREQNCHLQSPWGKWGWGKHGGGEGIGCGLAAPSTTRIWREEIRTFPVCAFPSGRYLPVTLRVELSVIEKYYQMILMYPSPTQFCSSGADAPGPPTSLHSYP